MRMSDWSSDLCASYLPVLRRHHGDHRGLRASLPRPRAATRTVFIRDTGAVTRHGSSTPIPGAALRPEADTLALALPKSRRSEEHTSELQSLMRISYAVFCLKKKKTHKR